MRVAMLKGNTTVELGTIELPQAPKRAAVAALRDVLATSYESARK